MSETLKTYLGGSSAAGGKLKETGFIYWNDPNVGATNEVRFNGRGSGVRGYTNFNEIKVSSCFISISLSDNQLVYSGMGIYYYENPAYITASQLYIAESIWLIADSGTPSSYTGNDGKVYRTVTIGTQTWLADNLAETKFRDDSNIPIVTDNSAWAALTTAGMCSYNNDDSNI